MLLTQLLLQLTHKSLQHKQDYLNLAKDVVVLGASYRLLTYLDPARAAQVSPQADETDSKRPYGASQNCHTSIASPIYTTLTMKKYSVSKHNIQSASTTADR
jgi:hypothetical protein